MLEEYGKCAAIIKKGIGSVQFKPIVEKVVNQVRMLDQNDNEYHVLLILTDGGISDMKDTNEVNVWFTSTKLVGLTLERVWLEVIISFSLNRSLQRVLIYHCLSSYQGSATEISQI